MIRRKLFVFSVAVTLMGSISFSEKTKPKDEKPSSISTVLELARTNNPAIHAARKKWEAEKEKIPQMRSFPDPMLTFVTFKEELQTRAGPLEEKYAISQKFPFFGKRGLKGEVAKNIAVIAEEAYKSKSLSIFSQVTRAYYELFFVDQSIKVNEELADQVRHFARVAERKYATGRQSQASVYRAQVELAKIINDLITFRQERKSALARLNSLLDRSPKEPLMPVEPTDLEFKFRSENLFPVAEKYRPEVLAARALIGKNEAAKSVAVREYFPDLVVGYEVSKIGAGTTNAAFDGEDAKALSFKVNVPIWYNRLNPKVRESKARIESAEAMLEDWINQTEFEVEDLVIKAETASRLIKLYKDTVLPQAQQALKSSQSGYEADKVRFLDLLDSIRMLLKFELEFYRYEANLQQVKAELEKVIGIPLADSLKEIGGVDEK